jgi:hypothetical protein
MTDKKLTGEERYLVVLDPFLLLTLRLACAELHESLRNNPDYLDSRLADMGMSNKSLAELKEFALGTSGLLASALQSKFMPEEKHQVLELDMMISEGFEKWQEDHRAGRDKPH